MNYKKFIERSFDIIDKSGQRTAFVLNKVQAQLLEQLQGKDLILKARQEGISSLILALFTCDFLTKENSRSVVISHEAEATVKLFDRVKFYLQSLEEKGVEIPLKYNSRHELFFPKRNSTFYIATAGTKALLRGETISNLHFSEIAFYPAAETDKIVLGAMQSVTPGGRILFESTANGMSGFFYTEWQRAKRGESNFKPHFFSWMDYYSKEYIDQKRKEFADLSLFKQEYPSTAEEAFISSGRPFFNLEVLEWYKTNFTKEPIKQGYLLPGQPPAIEENPRGYWKFWEEPTPGQQYLISADIGMTGDYSSMGILKRKSYELVATFHGHLDSGELAQQMAIAGTWYGNALLAPEVNGLGLAILTSLKGLNYSNIYRRSTFDRLSNTTQEQQGFLTTTASRPLALADLQTAVSEKAIKIYDADCLLEMQAFVRDEKTGKPQASPGNHDDRVIMLAILSRLVQETPVVQQETYQHVNDTFNQNGVRKSFDSFRIGR